MASLEDEPIFVILTSPSVRPIKVHSVGWNQDWPGGMLLNTPPPRMTFQMFKLIAFLNHWVPGIVCTLLGYFLSQGAFDEVGQTSLAVTQEWAV